MTLEDRARQAEGAAAAGYRETETYAKRNWLWLGFAIFGAGLALGRLWQWTHWPLF